VRVAIGLLVVGGCWTEPRTATTPSGESPAASPMASVVASGAARVAAVRPTTAPAPMHGNRRAQFPAYSVWSGTYTCNQGLTGVTLSIDLEDTDATAVFEFSAVPSNPSVPTGSSRMKGTITQGPAGANIELDPDAWISQPPGWFLVGVSATSDGALAEMHGVIRTTTCGAIDLVRGP
jgi:hypothetical protein